MGRAAVVDAELANAIKHLIQCPGGSRLFRYQPNGDLAQSDLDEAELISSRVIYVSSAHGIPTSIRRNAPSSACFAHGEFGRRALPRDFRSLFRYAPRAIEFKREVKLLARKTVLVCDNCGQEVAEGSGATMRVNFADARRGSKQADLCNDCGGKMPGRAAARRGRRPKAAAAS